MGKILAIDTSISSIDTPVNYSSLLTTLNSITPANNIETNLQTAAGAILSYRINDSLSSSQLTTLRTLANECPDWNGEGVYQAQALLALFDSVGTVYGDSACYSLHGGHHPIQREPTPQGAITSQDIINLYPNPNNGNFTLEYNLGKDVIGKIVIYNAIGELVGEYALNNSQGTMTISNPDLSDGVYIWKLYTDNQVMRFGKIIIIK